MTGSETILIFKGLTRNSGIGNTLVLVLLNVWSLGWVRNTKSRTNVSNKMLLNTAKCQGYGLYRFWVIKGNQQGNRGKGGGGTITLPTFQLPRLGVKRILFHHQTKWHQQKIKKCIGNSTIKIFCMFLGLYDVFYV